MIMFIQNKTEINSIKNDNQECGNSQVNSCQLSYPEALENFIFIREN